MMRTHALVLSLVLVALSSTANAQSPQIRSQLAQLGATYAPGQVPVTQIYGGFADGGQEMPYLVSLDVGRCYTFVGTVGPGVEQLSLYLFDPAGKTVTKDTSDRSVSPHVTHCPKWPGMYKILGKIKRGSGELAIQGFTVGGGPPRAMAAPPPQYAPPPEEQLAPPAPQYAPPPQQMIAPPPQGGAQSPFAGQLAVLAQTLAPGQVPGSPALSGFGTSGQETPFLIALQPGRCYTILGAVAPGVEQLSIYLVAPNGKTVVKDTTDRSITPHVTHCATFAGMYKLLGKVKRGQGSYAVQAFTTP